MSAIPRNFYTHLLYLFSHRYALPLLLILAALSSVIALRSDLISDDYLQWAMFTEAPALQEKGLIHPTETRSFWHQISNQFNFFDRDMGKQAALKTWGAIPWWTGDEASLHLFRPLSSVTHWIDYHFWPRNAFAMVLHSTLYYLLFIAAVYALYRRLLPGVALAGVATLFFILDPSTKYAITWVAGRNALLAALLGILAIFQHIRWCETKRAVWLAGSLLALLGSLLAAEFGTSAFAYLAAYALILDKGPLLQRLTTLLPSVVLIVGWRVLYQKLGFGALGIDHYIDPGRDPDRFLQQIFTLSPLLIFQQFIGLDNLDRTASPETTRWLYIGGAVFLLALLGLLASLLRRNAQARFWALGMLLATVPPCALAHTDGRVMFFIALGAFALVALYVADVLGAAPATASIPNTAPLPRANLFRRGTALLAVYFFVGVMLAGHVGAPIFFRVAAAQQKAQQTQSPYLQDYMSAHPAQPNQHLVLVNAPHPFAIMFYPYTAAYFAEPLPQTMRILSPAFSDVTVRRDSERQLTVMPNGGFLLAGDSVIPGAASAAPLHNVNLYGKMLGFYRRNEYDFQAGQQWVFAEMTLTILEVENGRPLALRVELNQSVAVDDFRFIQWDWALQQYHEFDLPAVGESQVLAGPFDSTVPPKT
ncbi:MAG TPA: hypothetical protein VM553_18595 [Dongiaceae bacterium]|nr:hypothetical protein [Dongiaceae bacterium]